MKKLKGPRSFMGYGSTATPTTPIETNQPVAVDPATERTAKLKSRAAEILAANAQQKADAQAAAQRTQEEARQRIEKVRQSCVNNTEWTAVLEIIQEPELYTRSQVLSGEAHEDALRSLRHVQEGIDQ